MEYGYAKKIDADFKDAILKVKKALSEEGFGVLTEINVKEVMKEKLNKDYDDYVILGACNPQFADKALRAEKEIGLLLPCNTIVYKDKGEVFASVVLPTVAMQAVENKDLPALASEVEKSLKKSSGFNLA